MHYVFNFIKSSLNKEIKKFDLKSSWAVCQFESDYNPIHWHTGHISGAGFLKVPENLGAYKQNKGERDYSGGNLNLIYGTKQFLSPSLYRIKPKIGDFYFFPNYRTNLQY